MIEKEGEVVTDIKDICYIRAKLKNDYVVNGREKKGYKNFIPYKDYNLFMRVLREIWFKLGFTQTIWFNPEIKKIANKNIIINDPLVTGNFINYVVNCHSDKNVFLVYENRVSATINPDSVIDPSVIKVTYDKTDSEIYNMHYIPGGYQDI